MEFKPSQTEPTRYVGSPLGSSRLEGVAAIVRWWLINHGGDNWSTPVPEAVIFANARSEHTMLVPFNGRNWLAVGKFRIVWTKFGWFSVPVGIYQPNPVIRGNSLTKKLRRAYRAQFLEEFSRLADGSGLLKTDKGYVVQPRLLESVYRPTLRPEFRSA